MTRWKEVTFHLLERSLFSKRGVDGGTQLQDLRGGVFQLPTSFSHSLLCFNDPITQNPNGIILRVE